jgi:S-methylmethionine-dependent homocysteine/selenocysteine methylase
MMAGVGALRDRLAAGDTILIDGGLSTALEEAGHDLSDNLWTARLLADDPAALVDAHRRYVAAGAEVVITASYQASVDGLAKAGFSAGRAEDLIRSSTALAREAVAGSGTLVAASVGPYGAYLADGSEYRGRYRVDSRALRRFHAPRMELLCSTEPDLLAVETIPCVQEAEVLADLLAEPGPDAWVSFTCGPAGRLRSGEELSVALEVMERLERVVAVGVNCLAPVDVGAALATMPAGRPLVVYPNGGGVWNGGERRWETPSGWAVSAEVVAQWRAGGVRILGGCCQVGPSGVAALAGLLDRRASR